MNNEKSLLEVKDENLLIDAIQSTVATYCYDNNDNDFEVVIKIKVEDGLAKCKIVKE